MPPLPTKPQLTPVVRQRLKEKFPQLQDEDLPLVELGDDELVKRIAQQSHRVPQRVRRTLEEIGAIVPRRKAVRRLRPNDEIEESFGSGVPDDTSQSGMMSGW